MDNVSIRYIGSGVRRLSWISKDKQVTYVVTEGEVLTIPRYDASIAMNLAPFVIVDHQTPEEKEEPIYPNPVEDAYETKPQSAGKENQEPEIDYGSYLRGLTVKELKVICKDKGLVTSGNKVAIIERILQS